MSDRNFILNLKCWDTIFIYHLHYTCTPLVSRAQGNMSLCSACIVGFVLKTKKGAERKEENGNQNVGSMFTNCEMNINNWFYTGVICWPFGREWQYSWELGQADAWGLDMASFLAHLIPAQDAGCTLATSSNSPRRWEVTVFIFIDEEIEAQSC